MPYLAGAFLTFTGTTMRIMADHMPDRVRGTGPAASGLAAVALERGWCSRNITVSGTIHPAGGRLHAKHRRAQHHAGVPGAAGRCGDPRLKEVLSALVRHLHEFAREVRLTEPESPAGIEFLTATGQMCDSRRPEFILLSDTLGPSMLTVAMNQARPPGATEATVFGPFHVAGAPEAASGEDIAAGASGALLFVNARVRGLDGQPVSSAVVDVSQADDEGLHDVQRPELAGPRSCRAPHRRRRAAAFPQPGGSTLDETGRMNGILRVALAADSERVQRFIDDDPYSPGGLFQVSICAWHWYLGQKGVQP